MVQRILCSISNVPSLAAGEGGSGVDKTAESRLPGRRQTEAAAAWPARTPPSVSGCECQSCGVEGAAERLAQQAFMCADTVVSENVTAGAESLG